MVCDVRIVLRHLLRLCGNINWLFFRCDADPKDLDNAAAELRTRDQLLELIETEDDNDLWFGYGIVPNFLVHYALPSILDEY